MSGLTRTQIYIQTETLEQVKIKAKLSGKTLSEYIREILQQSLVGATVSKPKLRITRMKGKNKANISGKHNDIYDS